MKTRTLIIVWAVALIVAAIINSWSLFDPIVGSNLAAQNVNGGNAEFLANRAYQGGVRGLENLRSWLNLIVFLIPVGVTARFAYKKWWKSGQESSMALALASVGLLSLSGCMKPYKTPQYVEVKPSETAFFIPLQGENKAGQVQFDSKAYESFKKIGVKRIEVPQEWLQTGRAESTGKWIPSARVIIVNRASVTREWTADPHTGSKNIDQAVSVESQDSVNFTLGFKVTAYVAEEDTSTFLYFNAAKIKEASGGQYEVVGLDDVMDSEVLARIQKVCAKEFGKYPLDIARTKKGEVSDTIDTDVIPFFKARGITIMTIAQLGGLTYANKQIQQAIDKTVMDQQEKVSAQAAFEAQETKNKTIKLAAEAEAAATLARAEGEAKGKLAVQSSVAEGMKMVSEAAKAAGSSEAYLKLRELEVQLEYAKQSKGNVPAIIMMGDGKGSSGANMLFSLPPNMLNPNNK